MRFYRVFSNSWLPEFFGKLFSHGPFQAWTVGPFIFIPGTLVEGRVLEHELRHVAQFYAGCVVGIGLWSITQPSWVWLLLTPLTYSLAYVLAGLYAMLRGGTFCHSNAFEVDARRAAGEPVE